MLSTNNALSSNSEVIFIITLNLYANFYDELDISISQTILSVKVSI